jgi:hypothetical protein
VSELADRWLQDHDADMKRSRYATVGMYALFRQYRTSAGGNATWL